MVRRAARRRSFRRGSNLNAAVAARSRLPITAHAPRTAPARPARHPPRDRRPASGWLRRAGSARRPAASGSPICTCATTVPFFCASPVKSSVRTSRPSRCAAIARISPAVMMPPPPMPANNARHGDHDRAATGVGIPSASAPPAPPSADRRPARAARPATVTKLGQKPLRQDRSTLHAVGLMRRLRPSAVSTGSMAMQLDCTEQSPQFSQTSRVDLHAARRLAPSCRACGGGAFRWRRPGRRSARRRLGSSRRSRCTASSSSRVCRVAPGGSADGGGQPLGLVGDDGDALARPRRRPARRSAARSKPPSAGCPPVIATASLNRIL